MMDHVVRESTAMPSRLGYAGVYSSFLVVCETVSGEIQLVEPGYLVELGRRRTVGGQEDMIEDLALDMARERGTL